ncbi:transporter substrate-binding domain-containing protein [Azospirillum halopraeferens]|uniref:transporter substrate-binding domain-containing protein n=1 Tax=Azospirillum halopraeferens TaxID=34010 RepID=UPI00049082D7|nr:transporter substrate-binding domain-containing protein [Azospirillum halopraeferens]
MMWRRFLLAVVLLLVPLGGVPGAGAGPVLDRVRDGGLLRCGVTPGGIGLSVLEVDGTWTGFFPDYCRAVAAAVAGGASHVDFIEVSSLNRFDVVRSGAVDVLMSANTWTLHRDAGLGMVFPFIYLYDGQGFMAHTSLPARRLADVGAATVCVTDRTTTVRNLEQWIARTGARLTVRRASTSDVARNEFFNHHCDLLTNDRIGLHAHRALGAPNPADYVILPDVISKEPLGPMIAPGDAEWERVLRWVFLATVLAEEADITAGTLASHRESPDPEVRALLGVTPGTGAALGLDDRWAARIIGEVGNYGEIFNRNLGEGSALRIDRGLNDLWSRGGLLYAPPLGG